MKKIILLALAALLIFTMVSCDGNADFLLWGDEATEKTITLVFDNGISNYWWYFVKPNEDSNYNQSVEITVSADTWGDLKDEALGYNLFYDNFLELYKNAKFSSYSDFMTVSADELEYLVLHISTSSGSGDESFVKPTDEIVDGKTYYVTTVSYST